MALGHSTGGNYLNIIGGKITQQVDEGTPDAVSRVNKNNKTVHELKFDWLEGKLIGIRTQDGQYGKNWIFTLLDNEDVYNLQLSYSNSYATALLKMLPNIDVTQAIKITPKQYEEDGKTKTALFVNQNGETIKHFYTKDEPKGLPQWEQIEVKGQLTWDSTKQIKFLENMVNSDIIPKLDKPESSEPLQVGSQPGSIESEFDGDF